MPELRDGAAVIRQRLLPDPAEQGADALRRGARAVLLPVEEDGAPRRVRQQEPAGEEKVRITSWRDVSVFVDHVTLPFFFFVKKLRRSKVSTEVKLVLLQCAAD